MQTEEGFVILGWPDSVAPQGTLLLLADPHSFPVAEFLRLVNAQVPNLTVVGGLASAAAGPGGNRIVADVSPDRRRCGLASDDIPVRPVVSQGCRPLGQPFTVTGRAQPALRARRPPAVRRLRSGARGRLTSAS
jgi:small ligand-binding sensory domain FIST